MPSLLSWFLSLHVTGTQEGYRFLCIHSVSCHFAVFFDLESFLVESLGSHPCRGSGHLQIRML